MNTNAEIGRRGEAVAVEWLRGQGFQILDLNWRNGRYEIDIVALRWDEIHFVEVKTRRAGGWTTPEQAIDDRKFRALRRAASLYLALYGRREEPCFDLAAVEYGADGSCEVRFREHAMEAHW